MNSKNTNINGFRSLLCILIVTFHFCCNYFAINNLTFSSTGFLWLNNLSVVVPIFFLISGFFLRIKTLKTFWLSKLKRTIFPFILCCLLILLVFCISGKANNFSFIDIVGNITILPLLSGKITYIDGAHWYIVKLLFFFIIFSFLYLFSKLIKKPRFLDYSLLCFGLLCLPTIFISVDNLAISIYRIIFDFNYAFIICGYFLKKAFNEKKLTYWIIFIFFSLAGLSKYFLSIQTNFPSIIYYVILLGMFILCIFNKLKIFDYKIFQIIGNSSLFIYLIHQEIGYLIIDTLRNNGLLPLGIILAFLFALIAGISLNFLYKYFEKKLSLLIQKVKSRKKHDEVEIYQADSNSITKASKRSVKWSLLGEIIAKISIPISTMILARLLTPEIYGITTAVTIVVTFCEAVTESGFSKFLIQHDFSSEKDFRKYFTISIIFSLVFSLLLVLLVYLFRYQLSAFVGNQGYEMVLVVSCIQVPFASLNAVYTSALKRKFNFKKVFVLRICYSLVPFIVTVPLAFAGTKHWSLVIGAIATQLLQLPFSFVFAKTKFDFSFKLKEVKETMLFSLPMIFESIVIWLCSWTSTIIAANYFDSSTVGIIKVSNSTVNSIFMLFSTAFTSVLFPTLSRLKNNEKDYKSNFYSIQSGALLILLPLGVGAFFYSRFISDIFLGDQWVSAAFVIGVFSLTKPLIICFNNFLSEVFRSKGHFYSSILYQLVMLAMDLVLKFSLGRISYEWFVWTTVISDILIMFMAVFILTFRYKFSLLELAKSFSIPLLCSLIMVPIAYIGANSTNNMAFSIAQVLCCAIAYFALISIVSKKTLENSLSFFKR